MSSPNTRLTRLLVRGFYPRELPPPFRTRHFTRVRDTLSAPKNYSASTTFFRGANHRGKVRDFGVVNPVSYLLLSRFIAQHWPKIKKVYALTSLSGTVPRFPPVRAPGRALAGQPLTALRAVQHRIASTYPLVVSLDISNFYGSIYTHSIPWAVLGKQAAKTLLKNKKLKGHWSDDLDILIRCCNQSQTVGIPAGPDTSRVISELILSRIDAELSSGTSNMAADQLFHHIDDYQIGAYAAAEAESLESEFVRVLARYELRLNALKTQVDRGLNSPAAPFEHWFDILEGKKGAPFVEHLFGVLLAATERLPQYNVAGYALKAYAADLLANPEQELVTNYLQRLLFASPPQARFVFPLLLPLYQQHGFKRTKVRRLLSWGIDATTRRGDAVTTLWYLFAAMYLQLRLDAGTCDACFGLSCELVDLVLFHGMATGLFKAPQQALRRRYRPADFSSSAWLPLYEVQRKGWDTSPAFSKIGSQDDNGHCYQQLRDSDVEFYLSDPRLFTTDAFHDWHIDPRSQDPTQKPGSSLSVLPYD